MARKMLALDGLHDAGVRPAEHLLLSSLEGGHHGTSGETTLR